MTQYRYTGIVATKYVNRTLPYCALKNKPAACTNCSASVHLHFKKLFIMLRYRLFFPNNTSYFSRYHHLVSRISLTSMAYPPPCYPAPTYPTIFRSAIHISSVALGPALLFLPRTLCVGGPAATLLLLLFIAALSFLAGQIIIISVYRSSLCPASTFSLGPTAQVSIIALTFLAAVACIYAIGDLDIWWNSKFSFPRGSGTKKALAVVFVLFPVTLILSSDYLDPDFLAGIYVIFSTSMMSATLIYTLFYGTSRKYSPPIPPIPPTSDLLRVNISGLLSTFPTICAAYMYHCALPGTLRSHNNPTLRRMTVVNALTVTIITAFYLVIASAGFLIHPPGDVPVNILTKPRAIYRLGAGILVYLSLFRSFNRLNIPLRRNLESGLYEANITFAQRIPIAAAAITAVILAAIYLPDAGFDNAISGAAAFIVTSYISGLLWRGKAGDGGYEPVSV